MALNWTVYPQTGYPVLAQGKVYPYATCNITLAFTGEYYKQLTPEGELNFFGEPLPTPPAPYKQGAGLPISGSGEAGTAATLELIGLNGQPMTGAEGTTLCQMQSGGAILHQVVIDSVDNRIFRIKNSGFDGFLYATRTVPAIVYLPMSAFLNCSADGSAKVTPQVLCTLEATPPVATFFVEGVFYALYTERVTGEIAPAAHDLRFYHLKAKLYAYTVTSKALATYELHFPKFEKITGLEYFPGLGPDGAFFLVCGTQLRSGVPDGLVYAINPKTFAYEPTLLEVSFLSSTTTPPVQPTLHWADTDKGSGAPIYAIYDIPVGKRFKIGEGIETMPWWHLKAAGTGRDVTGPVEPSEPHIPTDPELDPRDQHPKTMPSADSKWIAYEGKFTSKEFNQKTEILWGGNGRIYGLTTTLVGGGAALRLSVPGACIINGIVCHVNTQPIDVGIGVSGNKALVASVADAQTATPVIYNVVTNIPANTLGKAVLATAGSDNNWAATDALNIIEIAAMAKKKQFTDDEVRVLTSFQFSTEPPRDGNIDDASLLHGHRLTLTDETCFRKLTHYDPATPWPHEKVVGPPEFADDYHDHERILSPVELDHLTARGGRQSADTEHFHFFIPTEEQYNAVFGGPKSDASLWHTHKNLTQAHGVVIINPKATLWYVPQNVGNGIAYIDGAMSTFSGSVSLVLGKSSDTSPYDRIVKVRYKLYAQFMHSTTTGNFGGNPDPYSLTGDPIEETLPSPVPFGTEFTWRGIKFKVSVPTRAFSGPSVSDPTGDFFTWHGVIAMSVPGTGQPQGTVSTPVVMHERLLSYAPLRLIPVLDTKYPEGGFMTFGYI